MSSDLNPEYLFSIVLPRFGEDKSVIERTIHRLAPICERFAMQIIIVNDGREDISLEGIGCQPKGLTIIQNSRNFGKGFSVRAGVMCAKGRYVLYSDIDLPITQPCLIAALESVLENREIGLVIGLRDRQRAPGSRQGKVSRRVTSKWFSSIFRRLISSEVHDSQCPFKVIAAKHAKPIFLIAKINGYAFDGEIIHIAQKLKIRLTEREVEWEDTRASWHPVKAAVVFARMVWDLAYIRLYWKINHERLMSAGINDGGTPDAQRT